MQRPATILFDGICNLCNAGVRTIVANDPGGRFQFAALESEAACVALAPFDRRPMSFESIVLIESDTLFERSDAALRIACGLRWPWPLLGALFAVPRDLRDRIYAWIGKNRYRLFGRSDRCALPTAEMRGRFL